jgi:hypothetical protein
MKTSKKILITVGGFLVITLIISLFVMRNDMKTVLERSSVIQYQEVSVEYFETIEFSGNWKIRIKPGRVCKVELEVKNDTLPKPKSINKDGKQTFIADNENNVMHAKVTAPQLKHIIGVSKTEIFMQDYPSDSILIELRDSSTFKGKDNEIKNLSFKTSGNTSIQVIKTL